MNSLSDQPLSIGPTLFANREDLAGLTFSDSEISNAMKAFSGLALASPLMVKNLISILTRAVSKPFVLYTIAACQRYAREFPNSDRALSLLLIAARESDFEYTAVNTETGAFGLLQLLPSTVEGLVKRSESVPTDVVSVLEPLVPLYSSISLEEGKRLGKGFFTVPLTLKHPFDQVYFIMMLYADNQNTIDKWFRYDDAAGRWVLTVAGKAAVKSSYFKELFKSSLYQNQAVGRHLLFYDLWLHGPACFTKNKPMRYRDNGVNALVDAASQYGSFFIDSPDTAALKRKFSGLFDAFVSLNFSTAMGVLDQTVKDIIGVKDKEKSAFDILDQFSEILFGRSSSNE